MKVMGRGSSDEEYSANNHPVVEETTTIRLKPPRDDISSLLARRQSNPSVPTVQTTTTVDIMDAAASLHSVQSSGTGIAGGGSVAGGASVASQQGNGISTRQPQQGGSSAPAPTMALHRVENMPYTEYDNIHNVDVMGLYSGETNEYGQPHGRGMMKYDNGSIIEGVWVNGELFSHTS